MVVNVPFVCWEFDEDKYEIIPGGGRYYLISALGEKELAVEATAKGRVRVGYSVVAKFRHDYGELMPIGSVCNWNAPEDMTSWLTSMIYRSFAYYSGTGVPCCWFLMDVLPKDTEMIIPNGYHTTFNGANKIIWILLKHGSRIWPVRVVDNKFRYGWLEFRNTLSLENGYKIVLGCERRWIFEVFVLNEQGEHVTYKWSNPNHGLGNMYPMGSIYLKTNYLPSLMAHQIAVTKYGCSVTTEYNVVQMLETHVRSMCQPKGTKEITILAESRKWMIPMVNARARVAALQSFVEDLKLKPLEYMFVLVPAISQLQVMIFNRNRIERVSDLTI